jgi:hypothetical protein
VAAAAAATNFTRNNSTDEGGREEGVTGTDAEAGLGSEIPEAFSLD